MQRILTYRRRTQFDPRWGLWFWDNAMQSGADNNAALSNAPGDRSAILAVDARPFGAGDEDRLAPDGAEGADRAVDAARDHRASALEEGSGLEVGHGLPIAAGTRGGGRTSLPGPADRTPR